MTNVQAERSAIGAMLLDHRVVDEVFEIASPADFWEPRHETIARAIQRLAGASHPVDVISVGDELERAGELRNAGDLAYLHTLTTDVPWGTHGAHYARIVRDFAARRRLHEAGRRVVQYALSLDTAAEAVVEEARAEIDKVLGSSIVAARPVGDTLADLIASLADSPDYSPTPWASVNDICGGLRPGNMIVVGARPGNGKTVMAMNLAVALAKHGNVAFCSLEMSEGELQKRLIAQMANIHMSKLVNNALEPRDWDDLAAAREAIERLKIYVNDDASATVNSIRSFVRSVGRRGQLSGVVVDYAQLMRGTDPKKPRQEVVAEFSRSLKLLAKEFKVPVIVLSQLNRASEQRADKKPSLADLRESGAIEQDADVVFLISREADDAASRGEINVQVAKNRHGATDETVLAFQGHFSRMVEAGGFNPYSNVQSPIEGAPN